MLVGIAAFQAIKGAIDVMSDPISSYWTDSCRSKMGRRRPFLLAGCIPYAVFLILLLCRKLRVEYEKSRHLIVLPTQPISSKLDA